MPGITHVTQLTAEERRCAVRVVEQHAHDGQDEAELLAMLGLDQAEAAPPALRRPHGALSAAELVELLAPFAAERSGMIRC